MTQTAEAVKSVEAEEIDFESYQAEGHHDETVEDQQEPKPGHTKAVVKKAKATESKPAQQQGNSRPTVRVSFALGSFQAQQVYKRTFKDLSKQLYSLSIFLRPLTNGEVASKIEGAVDDLFNETEKQIEAEMERLGDLCDRNGLENDGSFGFSSPEAIEVDISSPRAMRYMSMIGDVDGIIGLTSLAWLGGLLTDEEYRAETYRWQRVMLSLSGRARQLIGGALYRANKGDKSEASNDAEATTAT